MEVSGDRVSGSSAAGDREAHPQWEMKYRGGKVQDYESFFRDFSDKILTNKGAIRVGGSLLFEYVPRTELASERLISAETSFYFHRMAEGFVYANDRFDGVAKGKGRAMDSYNYQKSLTPLDVPVLQEFMPMT